MAGDRRHVAAVENLITGERYRPGMGRHAPADRSGARPRPAVPLSGVRDAVNLLSSIDATELPVTSLDGDELWYKDAIIYQLHVKAFADSNNDGIGDFAGLTEKLDYLQDLGVTALWLLPFYPSPGRDDGYDIADYGAINPDFGTMKDFRRFIVEAKRRGLRVITELVINHTSDQHPWFQRARRSDPESSARNWYVWSDTDQKYAGHAHHLHRHREIELDLGSGSQAVSTGTASSRTSRISISTIRACVGAIMQVMKRWLDIGVDGFRLDAIPYLCERDGTNNENLPETHAIIKKLRAELDAYAKGKVLLAEANQWPEDVQRLFRRRRRMPHGLSFPADAAHLHGDRAGGPLSDHRHPAPDAGYPGQLPVGAVPAQPRRTDARNGHRRRARLSVVDLRQRSARAHQSRHPPAARAVDGQRPAQDRADELAAAVVSRARRSSITATRSAWATTSISATATACARRCNGRRTAMAASPAPTRRGSIVPTIMDPVYGYEAVNVEAQSRSLSSLLSWTKRLIAVRKSTPGVRPRHADVHPPGQPLGAGLCPAVRGRGHPLRRQSVALGAGHRARSFRRGRAAFRWKCSAARISRRSANCPT